MKYRAHSFNVLLPNKSVFFQVFAVVAWLNVSRMPISYFPPLAIEKLSESRISLKRIEVCFLGENSIYHQG